MTMKNITKATLGLFIFVNAIAFYRIGLDQLVIFYEHFLIASFGAAAWCFGLFRNEKNKHDKAGTKISFNEYREKNWDDWLWSFVFSLPLVWYMSDFIELMGRVYQLPEYSAYYLMAGPLSVAAGYGINWVINKFNA